MVRQGVASHQRSRCVGRDAAVGRDIELAVDEPGVHDAWFTPALHIVYHVWLNPHR